MRPLQIARFLLHHRAWAPGVMLLAALLRMAWYLLVDAVPWSDGAWYMQQAESWYAAGKISASDPASLAWPPGYPALLAWTFKLTGPGTAAVFLLNLAAGLASVWLSGCLARRLFASESVGRLTMLFVACYPNAIAYSSLPLSETVFSALLLAAVALQYHAERIRGGAFPPALILVGIFWGACCYLKPQVVFLPFLLLPWLRPSLLVENLRHALLIGAPMLLVLLPWLSHVRALQGQWLPVAANGGINLLIGHNPYATGSYHYEGPVEAMLPEGGIVERDRAAGRLAFDYIRERPLRAIAMMPVKLYYMYRSGSEGVYWNRETATRPGRIFWRLAGWKAEAAWFALLGLALAGMAAPWFFKKILPPFPLLCATLILYFTAISAVFFGYSRYHFPLLPFAAMAAAAFICSWPSIYSHLWQKPSSSMSASGATST